MNEEGKTRQTKTALNALYPRTSSSLKIMAIGIRMFSACVRTLLHRGLTS